MRGLLSVVAGLVLGTAVSSLLSGGCSCPPGGPEIAPLQAGTYLAGGSGIEGDYLPPGSEKSRGSGM